jgi:hypothetical protein
VAFAEVLGEVVEDIQVRGRPARAVVPLSQMVFRHCGPLLRLSHNEFVRLDIETPVWHQHGSRIIHCGLPGLEDEHPQLSEVLTPIVKIRKTVPAKDSLADPIPSAGQSAAKAGSESGRVLTIVIASRCG